MKTKEVIKFLNVFIVIFITGAIIASIVHSYLVVPLDILVAVVGCILGCLWFREGEKQLGVFTIIVGIVYGGMSVLWMKQF